MGAEAPAGRRTLHVRNNQLPGRLRLLRDGAEIAAAAGTTLDAEVEEPGAYRVEALPHLERPRAHLDPVQPDLPALTAT